MDFGVVGLDGFASSESGFPPLGSEPETRKKGYGSGFLKQERSGSAEDDWRSLKMAKTDDFEGSKAMLFPQRTSTLLRSNSLFSDSQQQQYMLSFSSPKSESLLLGSNNDGGLVERSLQNATLPYYLHSSSAYSRNTGLGSGSLNGNMHGVLTGVKGPFTPSQWMELEHQALIYKYITANVPIPSNLLIPIRKALNPSGFSGLSTGFLRPNALGWGSFHLGFSGSTDPEPGRCRRTDGKKWRCSRDAVADQKYCERHMNRGRHRSRKPVEGQTGHAVTGPATTKVTSIDSSSLASVVSGSAGGLAITQQHQIKSLQPSATNSSPTTHINRISLNKENVGDQMQGSEGLSMLSSTMNTKSKDMTLFSFPKHQNPFEGSSHRSEFGLVSSDSLLNPSQSSSCSYMNCRTSFGSGSATDLNDRESQVQQQPLRHFIDDTWPKNRSDHTSLAWPEVQETHIDRTQLSISIPVASSEFSSSSTSPTHEKLALSPLRLSRNEFDPIQMSLGVGSILNEPNQRQANWVPISWETSMGGPLGEVLHNSNNMAGDCKKSSAALNLIEGWEASPSLGSSPTGVLQKTTFGSLSNSSTGSSPRAENKKTHEEANLCDDLPGSTLVNSSSIPSL